MANIIEEKKEVRLAFGKINKHRNVFMPNQPVAINLLITIGNRTINKNYWGAAVAMAERARGAVGAVLDFLLPRFLSREKANNEKFNSTQSEL